MLKKISMAVAILVLLLALPVSAQIRTIEAEGHCIINKDCSYDVAGEQALLEAKKRALEKAGVKLDNYARILSGQIYHQDDISYVVGMVEVVEGTLKQSVRMVNNHYQKLTVNGLFRVDTKSTIDIMKQKGYVNLNRNNIIKKLGFMGIWVKPVDLYESDTYKSALVDNYSKGLVITEVFSGSPAEISSLKKNDIILKYNEQRIDDSFRIFDFTKAIEQTTPGNFMTLKILRADNILIDSKMNAYIKENIVERIEVCIGEKFFLK